MKHSIYPLEIPPKSQFAELKNYQLSSSHGLAKLQAKDSRET